MTASDEGSGRRIFGNTLAVGGSRAVNMLLALLLTPVLVRQLGLEEYGLYILATTLTFTSGFLSIGELGIQQSAVRKLAVQRREGDWPGVQATASSAVVIFGGVGLVAGIAVILLASPLTSIFDVAPSLRAAAKTTFALTGVQVFLEFISVGIRCAHEGAQRLDLAWSADLAGRLCWAGLAATLVFGGGGATAVVAAGVVGSAVTAVASTALVRRIPSQPRLAIGAVRRDVVVGLVRGATGFLGVRLVGLAHSQMDRLVLGLLVGSVAVGVYEVSFKVYAVAAAVLGVLPAAVMPATAFRSVERDPGPLRDLFLRGTTYAVGLTSAVVVALMIFADDLLRVWVGESFEVLAGTTRLFLVYPLLAMFTVIGQAMLLGLDRARPLLDLQAIALVLNVVVTVSLAQGMGPRGAVWGTVAGAALATPPLIVILCRTFEVSAASFVRTLRPAAASAALQIAVGMAFVGWGPRTPGSFSTVLAAGACGLVGVLGFAAIAIPRRDVAALLKSFPWISSRMS